MSNGENYARRAKRHARQAVNIAKDDFERSLGKAIEELAHAVEEVAAKQR
ncbi:hypothetical protein [Microbacterium halotolerans]|nr:hypothetical protein [Microbacterium halotolerans]